MPVMGNTGPVAQLSSHSTQPAYVPLQAAASVLSEIQLFKQVLQNRQLMSFGQQVNLRDHGGKQLGDLSLDLIQCITDHLDMTDYRSLTCVATGFSKLKPSAEALWSPTLKFLNELLKRAKPLSNAYKQIQLPLGITDETLQQLIQKGYLDACQFLDISECQKLSDQCLKPLSGLPNLTALKAAFSNIEFMNVAAGTRFRLLKSFDFNNSQCCESGVERIFKTMPYLQELNVSKAFVSIAEANDINTLPHLHKINVYDSVTVTTKDIENLASRAPNLQELQVSSYEDRVTEAIIPALTKCRHLQSLKLGRIDISSTKLHLLAQTHHQQLTSFSLQEAESFALDAFKALGAFTSLQHLDLHHCKIASDENLQYLSSVQQLKHLQMSFCHATGSGLSQISMPKLESVSLTKLGGMSLSSLKQFNSVQKMVLRRADNLYDSDVYDYCVHNPQLLHLTLPSYKLSDQSLRDIGQNLKQLQTLELIYARKITSDGIKTFCQSGLNLQHLNLEYGVKLINSDIDQICESFPDLKSLNLSYCHGLNSGVMKSIATNLRKLETLDMKYTCKGYKNPHKMYFNDIAALLRSNPKLKTIHVSKSDVDQLELFKSVASRSRRIQLH